MSSTQCTRPGMRFEKALLALFTVGLVHCAQGVSVDAPDCGDGAADANVGEATCSEGTDAEVEPEAEMAPSLRAAYVLSRQRAASEAYAVGWEGPALAAHNPAMAWSVMFGAERLELLPDGGTWSLRIGVEAFGCVGEVAAVEASPPEVDGEQPNQVRQSHGPLTAWYLNGPLGLEQGFDVSERPACIEGARLRIAVGVDGLRPSLGKRGEVLLRDAAGAPAMRVDGLYVTDADGAELEAALGVEDGAVVIDVDAAMASFPLSIDPLWSQQGKLTAADGAAADSFGWSASVDGDTALVGAYEDGDAGSLSGSAYVFVRNGNSWSQQAKLTAADGAAGDQFGYSVSVHGDTAVVGAYRHPFRHPLHPRRLRRPRGKHRSQRKERGLGDEHRRRACGEGRGTRLRQGRRHDRELQ